MISMLQGWQGELDINGIHYSNIQHAMADFNEDIDIIDIKLYPKNYKPVNEENTHVQEQSNNSQEYVITVKKYMTQKAVPEFDFMAKWNNDNPMPLRTMVGVKVKETRGMVYMKLHGDILAEKTFTCMACGRKLTNKISQYFGIGPECGGHNYTHPFDSEEELQEAVAAYKKELQHKTWEGWIIKSAIIEEEER